MVFERPGDFIRGNLSEFNDREFNNFIAGFIKNWEIEDFL